MDYKDTSERIALLTQEIRDLQRMNEPHSTHGEGRQWMDRSSREQRELRLKQIKQELLGMMSKLLNESSKTKPRRPLARFRRVRVVLLRRIATVADIQSTFNETYAIKCREELWLRRGSNSRN